MKKTERKKLCWNCEGSVSLDVEYCPFCGVSVVPAFLEGAEVEFTPPYSMQSEMNVEIPKSPYDFGKDPILIENQESQRKVDDILTEESDVDEFKRVAIAVTMLLAGSVFFLFSVALGLFSRNGIFTLQWDATYWYVYTILAIPLLFLGWRSSSKL